MPLPESPQNDQVNRAQHNKKQIKPAYFLIGFIFIAFILAFLIGGLMLGRNKNNDEELNPREQIKLTTDSIPDSPEDWKTYNLPTLGMEIKLPEKLSKEGEWKEQIIPAETGSIICFSDRNLQGPACGGKKLVVGGSSTDFSEGRGGTFTDLQGFSKENGKLFIKSTGGNKFELSNSKFKEMTNTNGVQIIKILGESGGTPEEGYLGAIINTKNPKYPGIAIQLDVNSDISEYEFDQILESIKFKN
jgi:hypothetical protein